MARRSLNLDPDPDDYYSATRFDVLASQLREVKRLLRRGSAAQLRVAYILLDNAAEVIMHRSLYPELINNEFQATLLKRWEEAIEGTDNPEVLAHYEAAKGLVITAKKLNKIENDFAEKANFLLGRGKLSTDTATSLKELHRYRNEMYHQDHVRYDVLRAVTAVYFDVVCCLVERYDETTQHPVFLGPPITLSTSARTEKFKPPANTLVKELRAGIKWDWPEVAGELKKKLAGRIEKTASTVWVLNLLLGDVGEEIVLKLAQTYRDQPTSGPDELRDLAVPYASSDLWQWARRIDRLDPNGDHIRFFNHFAEVERSFEALEEPVRSLLADLERTRDWLIEKQIEDARIEKFNRSFGNQDSKDD